MDRILKRQLSPGWGKNYIPGQLATRTEGPTSCRLTVSYAPKLGREVHLFGRGEPAFAYFALYLPNLFELHEQRMLSLDPRPHPLSGHAKAAGLILKPLKGTLDAADRLGLHQIHQLVRVPSEEDPTVKVWAAAPFLGDLLLFLEDQIGPYCVNLNVKQRTGDHELAFGGSQPTNPAAANERAANRTSLEIVYYDDADIPTYLIALDQLDERVVNNLSQLFGWHVRSLQISDSARMDIECALIAGLETMTPPLQTIATFVAKGIDEYICRGVLFQAIWRRRLRVDLFKAIVINKPLRPEILDVAEVYAHWLKRKP